MVNYVQVTGMTKIKPATHPDAKPDLGRAVRPAKLLIPVTAKPLAARALDLKINASSDRSSLGTPLIPVGEILANPIFERLPK